ncbi:MAG: hypothetical protein BWX80_03704 [Candidatus Hydrogenedentes bacterium ADurb.Bin101]|nr:MAG: hypothetical protein BWX80_03704 [Candidatus Hydrogenedentes bacterium ADurb.Bin101]
MSYFPLANLGGQQVHCAGMWEKRVLPINIHVVPILYLFVFSPGIRQGGAVPKRIGRTGCYQAGARNFRFFQYGKVYGNCCKVGVRGEGDPEYFVR